MIRSPIEKERKKEKYEEFQVLHVPKQKVNPDHTVFHDMVKDQTLPCKIFTTNSWGHAFEKNGFAHNRQRRTHIKPPKGVWQTKLTHLTGAE